MIIAHGIDLVEISSTKRLLEESSGQLLVRCFTHAEQAAVGTGVDRAERLAARLAAKEAVMKALGTGFSEGVGFLDVEVVNLPSGAPTIALHGEAAVRARGLGIDQWLISTSHEGDMAIASVLGLRAHGAER